MPSPRHGGPASRLAPAARRRQHDLLSATDAAGDIAARQVARRWSQLLGLLRGEQRRRKESRSLVSPSALANGIRVIVAGMHADAARALAERLAAIARLAHAAEAQLLTCRLPLRALRRAIPASGRASQGSPGRIPWGDRSHIGEAVLPGLATFSPGRIATAFDPPTAALSGGRAVSFIQHSGAGRDEVAVWINPRDLDRDWQRDTGYYLPPGGEGVAGRRAEFRRFLQTDDAVEAPRVALGPEGEVSFTDGRHRFAVLRDDGAARVAVMVPRDQVRDFEARYGAESAALLPVRDEDQRDFISDLLFPPLSVERVAAILQRPIAGRTWLQDLSQATRLASPDVVASIIANGFSAGLNPREIAALLRPAVQGVQTSARRVARTYGMQVAHRVQMDAHEQLGDLVIGYTVRSAKSPNSRKWHVQRSGTEYFLNPKKGQKGMAQCPHPPLEADDPVERPAGTPHLAFN